MALYFIENPILCGGQDVKYHLISVAWDWEHHILVLEMGLVFAKVLSIEIVKVLYEQNTGKAWRDFCKQPPGRKWWL